MENNSAQNSLLHNFSLNPLTFKPSGFQAGRFKNFTRQSLCYVNNKEFLLISKHAKTNELMICQLTLQNSQTGQIIGYSNYQEFSFGQSDEFRIYGQVKIAKTEVGSHLLSKYMKVGERKYRENFYIKYNPIGKIWMGCWGLPKKNLNLKIEQIMVFLAKERKLAFARSEETRFYCFNWGLEPYKPQQNANQKVPIPQIALKYITDQ